MFIIEKNGMDKCFVAYDSFNESSFTRRFNAEPIFSCTFTSINKKNYFAIIGWYVT